LRRDCDEEDRRLSVQVLLLAAATAQADWHSLGKVTGAQAEGNQITFHTVQIEKQSATSLKRAQ